MAQASLPDHDTILCAHEPVKHKLGRKEEMRTAPKTESRKLAAKNRYLHPTESLVCRSAWVRPPNKQKETLTLHDPSRRWADRCHGYCGMSCKISSCIHFRARRSDLQLQLTSISKSLQVGVELCTGCWSSGMDSPE